MNRLDYRKINWKQEEDDIKIQFLEFYEANKICECECHKTNEIVMHMLPCCGLTYQKYIDNNEFNVDKFYKLSKEICNIEEK